MEIQQHTLNNPWVKEVISKGIRKILELNDNENILYQISGMQLKWCLEGNL